MMMMMKLTYRNMNGFNKTFQTKKQTEQQLFDFKQSSSQYLCVCVCVGYDWTPCMSDPCHHLSTCIVEQHSPSVHTYKCACPHGFSGRNCQSGDVTHIMSSTVKRSSTVSPMNVGKVLGIPDRDRLHATWLRLSSHKLVTERGRWSRIPRQDRLCPCGVIPPVA